MNNQNPGPHRYIRSNTRRQENLFRMILAITIFIMVSIWTVDHARGDEIDVWIGTSGPEGIYQLTLDTKKGKMSKPSLAVKVDGAGFLALHPNGKFLYSTAKENGEGGVAAFRIDRIREIKRQLLAAKDRERELSKTLGSAHPNVMSVRESNKALEARLADLSAAPVLAKLNFLPTGDGGAACVGVDKTGSVLMSAQYGGGSTSTYMIEPDGSLGERVQVIEHGEGSGANPKRQAKSHPHWVGTSPDNRFLMVPDLGMDRVVVFELDSVTGRLKSHSKIAVPPGSGPRHMKFHTSGRFAYVLNELTLTISVFEYDAETAQFKEIQLIESLADELKDKNFNSAAEIRVHPTGKFVYSSNRGHDSISVFAVDQETGKLEFVERESIRGSWPRNFNIDPSGNWLIAAGARSNTLSLFEINSETGRLYFTQNIVNVPSPICVVFDDGR